MRIRTVKPEFWTDEQMSMSSDFSRLLAIALLNYADDDGYFLANPVLIRGACFPFQEHSKNIPIAIQELSKIGYLEVGELDDGRKVGRIINFRKHQRIDKPQLSKLKEKSQFQEHSKNDPRIIQEHSKIVLGGNGKGMEEEEEGKGKGKGKGMDISIEFTDFWNSYPKKVSKPQAMLAFKKAIEKVSIGKMIQSVNLFSNSQMWKDNDGKYIPNPATWLNGERWNDEPVKIKSELQPIDWDDAARNFTTVYK